MLPLSTVLVMSAISVFAGMGVASIFEALVGEADTPFKRACLAVIAMGAGSTTALFLLAHIK